jgi:hypothetical protein
MGGTCSTNGEKRNACRILVGKREGKRPLGRQRRRWVNDIKMDLREIGWGGVNWTDLAQDRDQWRDFVNTVMNLRVPEDAGKFLSSFTIGGFSRRAQFHEVSTYKVNTSSYDGSVALKGDMGIFASDCRRY